MIQKVQSLLTVHDNSGTLKFDNFWRIAYENRYVTHPLAHSIEYLNGLEDSSDDFSKQCCYYYCDRP